MLRLRSARAVSAYGARLRSSSSSSSSSSHRRAFSAQAELQQEAASPARPSASQEENTETIFLYHERTKHGTGGYADSAEGLKWEDQPRAFRRYKGAPESSLRHLPPIYGINTDQQYSRSFSEFVNPCILTKASVSQLLYDSLSVEVWKQAGEVKWPLRVNPSCGNLHPTEAYVICPPLAGVGDSPFIAHYHSKIHAMEIRAQVPADLWKDLTKGFPPGTMFVCFSSIYWREAWKYGARGYRYCEIDIGHAIGAVTMAGAAMGWDSMLLDGWGNDDLDHLLGLAGYKRKPSAESAGANSPQKGIFPELEQEHAHCIIAFHPSRAHQEMTVRGKPDFSARSRPRDDSIYKMNNVTVPIESLPHTIAARMAGVEWKGKPNKLSNEHVWWDLIDKASDATAKHSESHVISTKPMPQWMSFASSYLNLTLRQVLHKRRSAIDVDVKFVLQRESFYQMLWKSMPSGYNNQVQGDQIQFPFRVLPWKSEMHMAIFVHKVSGLAKGLYVLVRNNDHEKLLRKAMRPDFKWEKPEKCPQHLPLYLLAESNCELLAKQLHCDQVYASSFRSPQFNFFPYRSCADELSFIGTNHILDQHLINKAFMLNSKYGC
jgi:SagB-type dehydrogenase family enzyme